MFRILSKRKKLAKLQDFEFCADCKKRFLKKTCILDQIHFSVKSGQIHLMPKLIGVPELSSGEFG